MTRKFWSVAVIIFLIINTALIVMVWLDKPEKRQPPKRNGPVESFLKEELQLTEEQQKQFEEERQIHFRNMKDLLGDTREQRDFLFDQISNPDSSQIAAAAQRLTYTETQKEVLTVQHFRRLRAKLNVQQQQKFDKIFRDVLRMMSQRPEGGRPPGQQGPPHEQGPPPNGEFPPEERMNDSINN